MSILATRNSQLATRNSQLATRNSQLATRNSQLATRTDYVVFSVFCQPLNQAFSKFFEKALFVASEMEAM